MHERENFTDLHLLLDLWMESFVTLYKCPLDDSQQTNGPIFMSVTLSLTLVKYLGVGYCGGCKQLFAPNAPTCKVGKPQLGITYG